MTSLFTFTTNYVSDRRSCTIFNIQPVICRKSPILTYPSYLAPQLWITHSNFTEFFGIKNYSSWVIVRHCLYDPKYGHFETILALPTQLYIFHQDLWHQKPTALGYYAALTVGHVLPI